MKLENEGHVDRLFISAIELGPAIEKLRKNIASIGRQHIVTKYEFQPNKLIMDMTNGSGSFGEICILSEPESKQPDVSKESDDIEVLDGVLVEEASRNSESIQPRSKSIVESISISPEQNVYQKETRNRIEKENEDVPGEMPLKSSHIAEKKATFKLKPSRSGKYLIKSYSCPKPFRNTPKSEEVYMDEEEDMLYDGDRSFAIIAKDGVITLDEVVDVETTNTTGIIKFNDTVEAYPALVSEGASMDNCVICMDTVRYPKKIQCGHTFCTECIDQQFRYKPQCPICGKACGTITGDQPEGTMTSLVRFNDHLPGYEGCGSILFTYNFPGGRQESYHPSPGTYYKGIHRTAYLPNNEEGKTVLKMLKIAFKRKLIFTIGNSRTTGQPGVITWNDIRHKTDHRANTEFGYPDPTYLERVKYELAAMGVTEEDIRNK